MEFQQEFERAQAAAALANITEPRAVAADDDELSDRVVVQLRSGMSFSFSPHIAQGLAGATADDLMQVEIITLNDRSPPRSPLPTGDGEQAQSSETARFWNMVRGCRSD
jgi:HEAT repeat protein